MGNYVSIPLCYTTVVIVHGRTGTGIYARWTDGSLWTCRSMFCFAWMDPLRLFTSISIHHQQQLWNDDNTSSADSVSSTSSSTSSPIPSSLRFLLRNQQRYQYQSPSALINIITLGMMTRIPSLDPQEATLIEEQFTEIISSVGTCEKILRTPIPLGTLRYVTLRYVTLLAWCICINHSYKSTVRHNIDTTISILYDRIIMHLHVMSLASSCSLSRLLH